MTKAILFLGIMLCLFISHKTMASDWVLDPMRGECPLLTGVPAFGIYKGIQKVAIHMENENLDTIMPIENFKLLAENTLKEKYGHCNPDLEVIFESDIDSDIFENPDALSIYITGVRNKRTGQAIITMHHYRKGFNDFKTVGNLIHSLFVTKEFTMGDDEEQNSQDIQKFLLKHLMYRNDFKIVY